MLKRIIQNTPWKGPVFGHMVRTSSTIFSSKCPESPKTRFLNFAPFFFFLAYPHSNPKNFPSNSLLDSWLPPHNQIYSLFWYAFSSFLRKFYSVNPFDGNFCELGRARFAQKKDGISISGCQQNVFYSIFGQIRTFFEPGQRPCVGRAR